MALDKKPFAAVADWGTTRFRLWTLDRDGNVLGESRGDDGLLQAKEAGFESTLERLAGSGLVRRRVNPDGTVLWSSGSPRGGKAQR